MLDNDIIRPLKSPCASLLHLVLKKDESYDSAENTGV